MTFQTCPSMSLMRLPNPHIPPPLDGNVLVLLTIDHQNHTTNLLEIHHVRPVDMAIGEMASVARKAVGRCGTT